MTSTHFTNLSRRRLLGVGLSPFLASACPLPAWADLHKDVLVERLLQAALPTHCRHGRSGSELPFADLETALASRFGKGKLGAHLLAKLDIGVAVCRTWPIARLRKRLQSTVSNDFRLGLMIEVDGWYLSETEGIVYALAKTR